jgi:L-alanine-DL-glutamate epimerase-like enolase superfamily enzyme
LKIASVAAHPVSRVVSSEFAIVSAAGSQPESRFALIELMSDEGISGYGEASVVPVWSGESQESALYAISNVLAPVIVGKDPRHISACLEAMDRALIGNPFTKAGVEMALFDLVGKALGVNATVLLGGARRPGRIPLKFSIGAFEPSRAAKVAATAVEKLGLRAVKVKVGLNIETDLERVQEVRSAVGANIPVAVDGNGGWTVADTLAALPGLEKHAVSALEQPLRRGDFRGCAMIRQRTSIPLMLDESVFTVQDALEAIRQEACDLISIYPGKNGGLLHSMAIAELAASSGLKCVIGSNLEMDIGTAAMLTLAAAAPALASSVQHDIIGPLYYEETMLKLPIQYDSGCALAPLENSGLGIQLKETAEALTQESI